MKSIVFKVDLIDDNGLTAEEIDEIIYALSAQVEDYGDFHISYSYVEHTEEGDGK